MIAVLEPDQTSKAQPTHSKYPYLGKFPSGDVVLFIHYRRGVCVHGVDNAVGEYSYKWDEAKVKRLETRISLSNREIPMDAPAPRFRISHNN